MDNAEKSDIETAFLSPPSPINYDQIHIDYELSQVKKIRKVHHGGGSDENRDASSFEMMLTFFGATVSFLKKMSEKRIDIN